MEKEISFLPPPLLIGTVGNSLYFVSEELKTLSCTANLVYGEWWLVWIVEEAWCWESMLERGVVWKTLPD